MRKGTDLIGKAVVTYDTGERIAVILDVIFDQDSNMLLGFLVDEAGWFSSSKVIPFVSIRSIGIDAIIVSSKDATVSAREIQPIDRVLEHNNIMKGMKIISTDGRDLGTTIDLYFDELTGKIDGYEVSGGMFADDSGHSFVPAPPTINIGKEVALVPSETADLMQEYTIGVKIAIETTDPTDARLPVAAETTTSTETTEIVDRLQAQKEFILGKIAKSDVETQDGVALVLAGREITQSTIDLAEDYGQLDALYRSAGGGNAHTDTRVEVSAPERLRQAALGRRVKRSVYATDGYIIAATGQIVTAQVIERAITYDRQQALLESLGLPTGNTVNDRPNITGAQIDRPTFDRA
jgi:uncharacterized protein YrrD